MTVAAIHSIAPLGVHLRNLRIVSETVDVTPRPDPSIPMSDNASSTAADLGHRLAVRISLASGLFSLVSPAAALGLQPALEKDPLERRGSRSLQGRAGATIRRTMARKDQIRRQDLPACGTQYFRQRRWPTPGRGSCSAGCS